jgi:hypothetical protein
MSSEFETRASAFLYQLVRPRIIRRFPKLSTHLILTQLRPTWCVALGPCSIDSIYQRVASR